MEWWVDGTDGGSAAPAPESKKSFKGAHGERRTRDAVSPAQPTKGFVGSSVVSSPNVIRPAKKNDFRGPTAF